MFTKRTSHETQIDAEIDSVLADLTTFTSETEQYAAAMDKLEKLYAIRSLERPTRIDRNTLVTVAANLVGIALIVDYERTEIVTSKAIGFVKKLL